MKATENLIEELLNCKQKGYRFKGLSWEDTLELASHFEPKVPSIFAKPIKCKNCEQETNSLESNSALWPVSMWDGIPNSGKQATYCTECQSKMIAAWYEEKPIPAVVNEYPNESLSFEEVLSVFQSANSQDPMLLAKAIQPFTTKNH